MTESALGGQDLDLILEAVFEPCALVGIMVLNGVLFSIPPVVVYVDVLLNHLLERYLDEVKA
jgi:hypothetical protein